MLKRFFKATSVYSFISALSLLLRQNVLPTVAEAIGLPLVGVKDLLYFANESVGIDIILMGIPGLLINIAIETPLHVFTYFVVGLFYERGSNRAFGSFLYFVFYCFNIVLLTILSAWLS